MVSAGDIIRASDLGDASWTAITLQSGITTLATLQYRRLVGGIVAVSGKVSLDAGLAAGASKVVANAGGVPNARQSMDYAAGTFDGAHEFAVINIDTSGAVRVFSGPSTLGAAVQVSFNLFYEEA